MEKREDKKTYWNVWYSNPDNREKKKQYAKDRYYKLRDNILENKRSRLSSETEAQRQNRLQKMRDYYYASKDRPSED